MADSSVCCGKQAKRDDRCKATMVQESSIDCAAKSSSRAAATAGVEADADSEDAYSTPNAHVSRVWGCQASSMLRADTDTKLQTHAHVSAAFTQL